MTQAIYEFKVIGNEDVLHVWDDILKKQVEVIQKSDKASEHTKTAMAKTADAFKGISRDIGTIGGDVAQAYTHMADEALSVLDVLQGAGGTTMAVIAAAAIPVGLMVKAISDYHKEREEAAKAAAKADADEEASILAVADALGKRKTAITMETLARQSDLIEAHRLNLAEREGLIERLRGYAAEAKSKHDLDGFIESSTRLKEETAKADAERAAIAIEQEKRDLAGKKYAHDEANKAEAEASQEKSNKIVKSTEDRVAKEAAAIDAASKRISDAQQKEVEEKKKTQTEMDKLQADVDKAFAERDEKRRIAMEKEDADRLKSERDASIARIGQELAAEKTLLDERDRVTLAHENARAAAEGAIPGMGPQAARAHLERLHVIAESRAQSDEVMAIKAAEAEYLKTLDRDAFEAALENAEAIKNARIRASRETTDMEIKKQSEVEESRAIATNSARAHAAAMYAMAPALDIVTGKMSALRDVNRETAGDFLKMADDAPQAAMKYAQGILTGIAMQATGEAALEAAKAVGDVAGSVTAFAYGNVATGTALMESAGMHAAAAAGYAAIAGGGAGAAFAIGAVRPPTNDEKKTQAQRQDGGATSTGPSSGGGSGMGGSSGPAVTNVYLEYGGRAGVVIAPETRQRATQAISEATARAQRNPFYQLANRVTQ